MTLKNLELLLQKKIEVVVDDSFNPRYLFDLDQDDDALRFHQFVIRYSQYEVLVICSDQDYTCINISDSIDE